MVEKTRDSKVALSHEQLIFRKFQLPEDFQVISECYCHNGHSLISDAATFSGFDGLTVELRKEGENGQLALSPIVGDMSRTFFNFVRKEGDLVDICCPTCHEPLPYYDACICSAFLVAMFTSPNKNFANCIGICQRIGCLHSKIISNYNLRKYSRNGYF